MMAFSRIHRSGAGMSSMRGSESPATIIVAAGLDPAHVVSCVSREDGRALRGRSR